MKKFVNDPAKFVPEMLEGVYLANSDKLKYEPKYNIIYRADRPDKNKVSIIQGSGSDMSRRTSWPSAQGRWTRLPRATFSLRRRWNTADECIKLMSSPKGVLVLINNYQGDRHELGHGDRDGGSRRHRREIVHHRR